jgi:hypothetical protein
VLAAGVLAVGSSGKLLPGTSGVLAPTAPIAWRPATLLGANIGGAFFYSPPTAGQKQYLWPAAVSFIRAFYSCYTTPSGWAPNTFSSGVRNVQTIQPYATDPTQFMLSCDQGTYAVQAGDPVVLSAPVSYQLASGSAITLPAQTPLTCMGGTAGTFSSSNIQTSPCTIRVAAGGTVPNNGAQAVSGVMILHQNFYTGGTTLRPEIASYTSLANGWLAQGFAFDHGGYADNWGALFSLFGISNVQPIREQEWAYFAGLGWNPARVHISDENEMSLDMNWTWKNYATAWQTRFKAYFQGTLYPRMRYYFPAHTLGFGFPADCAPNATPYMDWWPADPNTTLRLHVYMGPSATGFTGDNPADIATYFNALNATIQRIGVPRVHMQEFNVDPSFWTSLSASEGALRIGNLRRAALEMGWLAAGWTLTPSGSLQPGLGNLGTLGSDGLFRPNLASGGFGLT